MKKIFLIALVLVTGFTSFGQFTKARLQATGLTCAMCSNAINKELKTVSFIQSVESDIKNSAFDIVFKENAEVDIDVIRKAVEDAGFAVGNLKLTGRFENVTVENDRHVQINKQYFHFLQVDGQVLNGEKTMMLVDKDFLTAKQFKRFSKATSMACVQTGKASGNCCKDITPGTRIYHVTI